MKKSKITAIIIIMVLLVTVFPSSIKTAHGDSEYYRVVSNGVYLNSNASSTSAVFELPLSYYVKKTGEVNEYYHVECYGENDKTPKIDGYVLKEELKKATSTNNPYLSLSVKTNASVVLYKDKELKEPLRVIFPDKELGYYGKIPLNNGGMAYYVNYGAEIGYVKEEFILPFTVPMHETPIESEKVENNEEEVKTPTEKPSEKDSELKVIVIVAVVLSAIIILGLIVIPEKKNAEKKSEY